MLFIFLLIHKQAGPATNGSAANGAGQQMIDPSAQGYTFIDPSYALALHQVRVLFARTWGLKLKQLKMQQYTQTSTGAQQPSTAAQTGGTEQQRY